MFYTVGRFFCFLFFKIFFRLRIFGRENFPKKGPLIVAPNHVSFFDPILVGVGAPRKLYYLARDTLFKFKPFAIILHLVNTFPLKREGSDVGAFKFALSTLKRKHAILIFPEGTRAKTSDLQEPKYGIGFLQARSNAAVIPCYVKGSDEALPRHCIFPRPARISVYFGKPLSFESAMSEDKKDRYVRIAEKVMKEIRILKEQNED